MLQAINFSYCPNSSKAVFSSFTLHFQDDSKKLPTLLFFLDSILEPTFFLFSLATAKHRPIFTFSTVTEEVKCVFASSLAEDIYNDGSVGLIFHYGAKNADGFVFTHLRELDLWVSVFPSIKCVHSGGDCVSK